MGSALADTGAQSNLWGWKNFKYAGYGENDLLPVLITIRAANNILMNYFKRFQSYC